MLELPTLTRVLEAILFLSPGPVTAPDAAACLGESEERVLEALRLLAERYSDAGLELQRVAGGYELVTRPEYVQHLKKYFSTLEKERLSRASLETLAIIAYRQPVTRAEIEAIRGVNSSGVLYSLLDKNLVRISGKSDKPGKPFLFSTTPEFLRFLGLNDLADLPPVESLQRRL
ncbi:MAG: SMC-Scp complex subunit ScpB [bacterium]